MRCRTWCRLPSIGRKGNCSAAFALFATAATAAALGHNGNLLFSTYLLQLFVTFDSCQDFNYIIAIIAIIIIIDS